MGFSIKDNIQKFSGYFIGSIGLLIMLLGIAMYLTSEDPTEIEAGAGIAIFSISLVAIAGILIYIGHRNSKMEEEIETAASIIKSYRRIKLYDLAEKMHVSVTRANIALSKAVSLKLISGNFDRTTDEFFTEEGKFTKIEYKFCPSCGAPFSGTFLEGDTIKCDNCGAIV